MPREPDELDDLMLRGLPEDASLPEDSSRSVLVMLMRAREAVMSHLRPSLASADLTEPQWRVLRVLGGAHRLEPHEVAARASLLSPSLTRIVQSLEQRALVSRQPLPGDRRRLYLSITPGGLRLIHQITAGRSKAHAAVVERFGEDRLDVLLDLLGALSKLGRNKDH